jgi:hypothetical protein
VTDPDRLLINYVINDVLPLIEARSSSKISRDESDTFAQWLREGFLLLVDYGKMGHVNGLKDKLERVFRSAEKLKEELKIDTGDLNQYYIASLLTQLGLIKFLQSVTIGSELTTRVTLGKELTISTDTLSHVYKMLMLSKTTADTVNAPVVSLKEVLETRRTSTYQRMSKELENLLDPFPQSKKKRYYHFNTLYFPLILSFNISMSGNKLTYTSMIDVTRQLFLETGARGFKSSIVSDLTKTFRALQSYVKGLDAERQLSRSRLSNVAEVLYQEYKIEDQVWRNVLFDLMLNVTISLIYARINYEIDDDFRSVLDQKLKSYNIYEFILRNFMMSY